MSSANRSDLSQSGQDPLARRVLIHWPINENHCWNANRHSTNHAPGAPSGAKVRSLTKYTLQRRMQHCKDLNYPMLFHCRLAWSGWAYGQIVHSCESFVPPWRGCETPWPPAEGCPKSCAPIGSRPPAATATEATPSTSPPANRPPLRPLRPVPQPQQP